MSPKIRLRPVASRTKMPPSTRPVKTWAASADADTSSISRSPSPSGRGSVSSGEPLLGAGAVELLVGRDERHDFQDAPLAAQLAGAAALDDPEVLHRLVVALPPPLLALVVVVSVAGPEGVRHLGGVGGLGQLDPAGDLHDAAVGVGAVIAGRH